MNNSDLILVTDSKIREFFGYLEYNATMSTVNLWEDLLLHHKAGQYYTEEENDIMLDMIWQEAQGIEEQELTYYMEEFFTSMTFTK